MSQYAERWKRLGERLHPHEHPQWPGAQEVFAVARSEIRVPSFGSRVEAAMRSGDVAGAATLLARAPGRLMRSVDWLLRSGTSGADGDAVLTAAQATAGQVSGRVLLSVREHVQNRGVRIGVTRVFVNRKGRAHALPEAREALDRGLLREVQAVLDAEAARRVPAVGHLVVDPAVAGVALPLSGKAVAPGLGMLPRGSVSPVDGEWLRFFVYWHQNDRRTDYDLSALMLDEGYANAEHVSWTNLRTAYAEYSGDLIHAENGASEFINIRLPPWRGPGNIRGAGAAGRTPGRVGGIHTEPAARPGSRVDAGAPRGPGRLSLLAWPVTLASPPIRDACLVLLLSSPAPRVCAGMVQARGHGIASFSPQGRECYPSGESAREI